MYHAIVRRRLTALFAAVSNGDARPVLEGLAPRFEHFFLGDHCGTSGSIGCCRTSVSICALSGFLGRLGTLWLQWIGWKAIQEQTESVPSRRGFTASG